MTDKVAEVEFAGLENDGPENDGLEQEQTYVLHTLKTFNVYVLSTNLKTYYTLFRVILIKNMINKRNHTMTTVRHVSQCCSLRYSFNFSHKCPELVGPSLRFSSPLSIFADPSQNSTQHFK